MAAELWESEDTGAWKEAEAAYNDRRDALESEALSELDAWVNETLVPTVRARSPPHLTQPELCRLMQWKITRGKWRPLMHLVKRNSEEAVVKATTAAFKAATAGNVKAAVKAATVLAGVGPATCTAILCLVEESIPFMSDEALVAALSYRKYTVPCLLEFTEALRGKATALGGAWTAQRVQQALWSADAASMPSRAKKSKAKGKAKAKAKPAAKAKAKPAAKGKAKSAAKAKARSAAKGKAKPTKGDGAGAGGGASRAAGSKRQRKATAAAGEDVEQSAGAGDVATAARPTPRRRGKAAASSPAPPTARATRASKRQRVRA